MAKNSSLTGTMKYTLSTGKEVSLRPKRIADQLDAAQAIGEQASNHPMIFSLQLAHEMTRRLVTEVDGKPVSQKDLLDLDSFFSDEEFGEVMAIVGGKKGSAQNPTTVKFESSSGSK